MCIFINKFSKTQSNYKEIAACSRRDGKKSAMDTWGTTSKHLLGVIERYQSNPDSAKKIDMELE